MRCEMKRFDCQQGSPEWFALRRGIPTASEFHRIITPIRAQLSKQCDSYIYDLIGALADSSWTFIDTGIENGHMERGRQLEPEARGWLSMTLDVDIEQVGFCLSDCERWVARRMVGLPTRARVLCMAWRSRCPNHRR